MYRVKWLLFKLAFLYPRIYAFFCYYRKKAHQREYEEKVNLFYNTDMDPKGIRRIVRGIFELRGVRKIQRYLIPLMDNRFIQQFVTIEGLDILDRALTKRRGIILMSAHIGNFHIGFNILRVLGYEINFFKGGNPKKQRSRKLRYVDPNEYTIFSRNAPLSNTAKHRILEILRSGRIIYYTVDAEGGRRKVGVSMLGRTMHFSTGMLHFALQADAAVLPFFHLYRRGKIKLIFKEPIDGDWRQGEEDYQRIMEEFAKLLEYYILAYPKEYMGIYGPTVLNYYYRSSKENVKNGRILTV
jgi:Kdo2-lipid IVA lauroyltransferase/acyltransferase